MVPATIRCRNEIEAARSKRAGVGSQTIGPGFDEELGIADIGVHKQGVPIAIGEQIVEPRGPCPVTASQADARTGDFHAGTAAAARAHRVAATSATNHRRASHERSILSHAGRA